MLKGSIKPSEVAIRQASINLTSTAIDALEGLGATHIRGASA